MTRTDILRALLFVTALSIAPIAEGITVRPVTVAELTHSSDDVIVGTVRRSVSRWVDGFIVTDHEVEVEGALKGRLPPRATVVVRVAGGVVGRIGQHIPGAPTLEDGRTYMLFLSGGISTARYLAHMTAAVVPVTLDPAGRAQVSMPDGLSTTTTATSSAAPIAHPRATVAPLDHFARSVRAVTP